MNPLAKLLQHKSQTYQRIITSFILFSVFFGCLWGGPVTFSCLLGVAFLLGLREWITITKHVSSRALWVIGGSLYIALGFTGMGLAALYHPFVLVAILFLIWTTDTGAYFIGKTFGGPKLAPSVSPGKTWSGTLGGSSLAVMGGSLVAKIFDYPLSYKLVLSFFVISVVSIMGDLVESFVKRRLGVKDSGTLLPGHGGLLDRLDSPMGVGVILCCIFLVDYVYKANLIKRLLT